MEKKNEDVDKKVDKKEDKKVEKKDTKTAKNDTKVKKEFKCDKKVVTIVCVVIAIILVIALVGILISSMSKPNSGNTISNIRNVGYSVSSGKSIYYVAPANVSMSNVGIFEVDKKGENKKEIYSSQDNIFSLNVSGDYIYFITIGKEVTDSNDRVNNKICRVKKDGSNFEVLNDNDFNNNDLELYVVKDNIYYIGLDEKIYKMKLNGKDRELVSDAGKGFLAVTNKYIIFNREKENPKDENDYETCIMNLKGENIRPIIPGERIYSVDIQDNYIYYANADQNICRTKIDTGVEEVLYDVEAYNLNLSGDYFYYLNYENYEESKYDILIFRCRKDGKGQQEVVKKLDSNSSFINVVDDWVLYRDSNEKFGFIDLVKIDGTKEQRLFEVNYEEAMKEAISELAEEKDSQENEVKDNPEVNSEEAKKEETKKDDAKPEDNKNAKK